MDPTERWIRTLLMYIFYDVYRDRHLSVAYLEAPFRESAFIPILSFPPSNSHPSTAGCAAWIRGILYLMRVRVKHETGLASSGQRCVAARKLGISMTRARLRPDLGPIVFYAAESEK